MINHLLYADDMFAPSAKGLQKLLDVCSNFAVEHDTIINNTKSQVMFFKAYEPFVVHPCFVLSNMALLYTLQYKYLGHLLTNELHDDNILKQVRSLYMPELMCFLESSAQYHSNVVQCFLQSYIWLSALVPFP